MGTEPICSIVCGRGGLSKYFHAETEQNKLFSGLMIG
jgi:hypothetical protein